MTQSAQIVQQPVLSTKPLAEQLLLALKGYGAKEIFGIPGDFVLPFFKEIEACGILPLFTLSHEPAIGFAADAAGRYHGTLGVACITYGAGALNMINPIATAYAEKSPLVVISGAPSLVERGRDLELHHQVKHLDSQMMIMREVTCAQCVLDDPQTAPLEIARVLQAARDLSRPVYIELPRDMPSVAMEEVPAYNPPTPNKAAAKAAAKDTMHFLKQAKAPALMLGVEVRRFNLEDKVAQLAIRLDIPVVTTFMARGILAGHASLDVETYIGLAGPETSRQCVEASDGLLMLGVIMSDTNFGVSARQIKAANRVLAVDQTIHHEHHSFTDISLSTFIDAMLEEAEPLSVLRASTPCERREEPIDFDSPITPEAVAETVSRFFDSHGPMPIASDMGDCLFTAMDINHAELLAPGYYATMGTGIPFGIGLEIASAKRPLVLVGDGAFQMTGWELGNCKRLGLAPIVLVFNNRAWGMLKAFQNDTAYNDLDEWNFAQIAETLGGKGTRVSTPATLLGALESAKADTTKFQLIEIMLPREAKSKMLTRFTEIFSQKNAAKYP